MIEKIKPCPYCGAKCEVVGETENYWILCSECSGYKTAKEAIAGHNRVSTAVKEMQIRTIEKEKKEVARKKETEIHFLNRMHNEQREKQMWKDCASVSDIDSLWKAINILSTKEKQ